MYFTTKFFLTQHVVISLLSSNRYAFLPFFSDLFIYLLFLVALGLITFLENIYLFFKHWIFIVLLHGLSLVSASWGYPLVEVCRLLVVVASLAMEHVGSRASVFVAMV